MAVTVVRDCHHPEKRDRSDVISLPEPRHLGIISSGGIVRAGLAWLLGGVLTLAKAFQLL